MQEETPGWFEPVAEGLWKPDELFGLPRQLNWMHLVFGLLAMLNESMTWIWTAVAVHFVFGLVTIVEPEWPAVLNDLIYEPGEIES